MGHPLTEQQRQDIKNSWSKVLSFGLQEAGIIMFKRLCILSTCLYPYNVLIYVYVYVHVFLWVLKILSPLVRKAVAIAVNLSTTELTLA